MLTHYGKLKNLSLAEIADLCYDIPIGIHFPFLPVYGV